GPWSHSRAGDSHRAERRQRAVRPHLPGSASGKHRVALHRGTPVNDTRTSTSTQQQGGITLSQLWAMLTPWRWFLALVGISVLLGAVVELVPPLLMKQIVDAHLKLGRCEGLLVIASLYLGAPAAVQVV